MPTKIRLQRHGKKRFAYFHVVIADSRAPRDGKFIEKIGTYNPNTNPASIELQFDKALDWLKKGAQPTDTVRALLSYKGVIYKNHLDKGVTKGAFSQEEAEKRFEEWMKTKEDKIAAKTDGLANAQADAAKKQLEAEAEANKKRAEAIAAKNVVETEAEAPEAEVAAEALQAEAVEAPAAEESTQEAPQEEVKAESNATAEDTNTAEETDKGDK
jgi:small subunit ribosomal protein S16